MASLSSLAKALSPLTFLALGFIFGIPPFILFLITHPLEYIVSADPISVRIKKIQSRFFYYVWRVMSPLMAPNDKPNVWPLLARCKGTVLEIGAGVGGNIQYYRRSQVTRLICVEPNTHMHDRLRKAANDVGFWEKDGSLLILACGGAPSDEKALALAGVGPETMDSIAVVHVLCGIPQPAGAVEMYRRILKKGGQMVFYEHVKSTDRYISEWQSWYTKYFWPHLFDGCCMDRDTGAWIMQGPNGVGNGMEEQNSKNNHRWADSFIDAPQDQAPQAPLPHVMGYVVK